eukprot:CAMPEP_0118690480 /NCGR_PEP_ID=MMETSP0800-20121206/10137_1 /TAXON_ID=210618 ORGANISM="Striatella unipunctata, Strain CCMP2910" /NCGR_SAMPLE_ID=MMETSP0800 /ASSEMBLY_ACC=CAM_ASM_000638 /LENGTH=99 /DNA_ID=CAMNT_0006588131 /DNA_START=395 /DNA_END=694 /DNA_ORIENTATION=-
MVTEATKPNPRFLVTFGFDGWLLSTATAGMSPESSFLQGLAQVVLMGAVRLIAFFVLTDFWEIVRECDSKRQQRNNNNSDNNNSDAAIIMENYGSVVAS